MKYFVLFISLFFLATNINGQEDVIVNVSGKFAMTFTPFDTIVIENLTKADTLTVSALPQDVSTYLIDLTTGKILNGIEESELFSDCNLLLNTSELKQILLRSLRTIHIDASVFGIDGRLIISQQFLIHKGNNVINMDGGTDAFYVLNLKSNSFFRSFKMVGGSHTSKVSLELSNETSRLKTNSIDSFDYEPGDELLFTGRKSGSYSNSVRMIPVNGDSINIYLSKPCPGIPTVSDFDGNIYKTVLINNQCWLKENIKSKHYSDGTPLVDGTGIGASLFGDYYTKYWFDYDDNPVNSEIYGRLYTGAAALNVDDGQGGDTNVRIQGICPDGWHVPSHQEWKDLEFFIGIPFYQLDQLEWRGSDQGNQLKEIGSQYWWTDNGYNKYGFSAVGSGGKGGLEGFSFLTAGTFIWSSSSIGNHALHDRVLNASENGIYNGSQLFDIGYSCRCIKD